MSHWSDAYLPNALAFLPPPYPIWASLVAQVIKSLPAMQETQVWFLGLEDPLEKGMATHSSILVCRILWTEEPGGLHSVGSQSWTRLSDEHTQPSLLLIYVQYTTFHKNHPIAIFCSFLSFLKLCLFLCKYLSLYMCTLYIYIFFFSFQVELPYILSLPWQQKREFHLALEVPTNYPDTDPWIELSLHLCLRAPWLSWSFSSSTSSSWRSRSNTSSRSTWTR